MYVYIYINVHKALSSDGGNSSIYIYTLTHMIYLSLQCYALYYRLSRLLIDCVSQKHTNTQIGVRVRAGSFSLSRLPVCSLSPPHSCSFPLSFSLWHDLSLSETYTHTHTGDHERSASGGGKNRIS